jgi:hypothetical protein
MTIIFEGVGVAAANIIRTRGWTTEIEEDGETGEVCLEGAVRLCQPRPGDGYICRAVWRHWGAAGYNDEDGRTLDEVLTWAAQHADITDADLLATFGPQWEPGVALMRRLAVMTRDEAAAAGSIAGDAVYAAADVAVYAVAVDAVDAAAAADVAADAAGGAGANAYAYSVCWRAAYALAVRHLIGQVSADSPKSTTTSSPAHWQASSARYTPTTRRW